MAPTNPTGGTGDQPSQAGTQPGKGGAKAQQEQKGQGEPRGAGAGAGTGRRGGGLARRALADLGALAPFRYTPFSAMRRMMEDLDRMFDEMSSGTERRRMGRELELGWMPCLEVFERDEDLVVRADLPGLRKEDIRILARDDSLVIEGERRREKEEERGGMYRTEVAYGAFRRAIPLPEEANAENADARFENGVLEVRIPLEKEAAKSRRIEIKGGEGGAVH